MMGFLDYVLRLVSLYEGYESELCCYMNFGNEGCKLLIMSPTLFCLWPGVWIYWRDDGPILVSYHIPSWRFSASDLCVYLQAIVRYDSASLAASAVLSRQRVYPNPTACLESELKLLSNASNSSSPCRAVCPQTGDEQ